MMSQDLLERILINEIDIESNKELIEFLKKFKKDEFIYPSVIKRKFNLEDKQIYNILKLLEDENILKLYYEVFCGYCSKSLKLYEYYSELEKTIFCDDCEEESITLNNIKIIYKVVNNGR